MASTDPIGLQPSVPIAMPIADDLQAEPMLRHDDVSRVRVYHRLSAALSALAMVGVALAAAWLCVLLLDWPWRSVQILVPMTLIVVLAVVRCLKAEMRLRTYRLSITADAVVFAFGRTRSYVPRRHIQVFDTESAILLRMFGLTRCNLLTGGGMVVVSPVPARAAAAIERVIAEPLAVPPNSADVPGDRSTSAAEALGRKRRLHPLAILMPFSSYSRPPRLGRSMRLPRRLGLVILFAVLVVVDVFTDIVTVTSDGGVLIERDHLTQLDLAVLSVGLGSITTILVSRWWTFRWWVEDDAVWTSGGLVNRWRRRVALGQIATIDRSSSPVRRIFGVSRIEIESTAADQAAPDILFGYLSKRDADRLEHLLITRLVEDAADDPASQFNPLSVDRLGWWELFLAGATTSQIARAVVVLYAASQFVQDEMTPTLVIDSETTAFGLSPVQFAVAQILSIALVLWLVSTLYFVVSFARFRLGTHGGWLVEETGVIRPVRRLIKVDAIQGLEVYRSPLQRRFRRKRAMLRMRLTAYGTPSVYAMVLHPAVADAALPTLTQQLVGMEPATSGAVCGKGIHRLAAGCRSAYTLYWPIRIVAVSAALVLVLLAVQPQLWWWALTPLLLAGPLALAGWLAWTNTGWYANHGDWLVIQRGTFGLTSTAARVACIEYVTWSSPLRSRQNPNLSMAISVSTSRVTSVFDRIPALLRRPVDPALIRIGAMQAADARSLARASGLERSLPPALVSE